MIEVVLFSDFWGDIGVYGVNFCNVIKEMLYYVEIMDCYIFEDVFGFCDVGCWWGCWVLGDYGELL